MAVIAALQVDAHFLSRLHFERVHSFASLGNVDLAIALHVIACAFGNGGMLKRTFVVHILEKLRRLV